MTFKASQFPRSDYTPPRKSIAIVQLIKKSQLIQTFLIKRIHIVPRYLCLQKIADII